MSKLFVVAVLSFFSFVSFASTKAGIIPITEKNGVVDIFYTENIQDTLDEKKSEFKRPITFIYNGGPGASTTLLRLTSFDSVHMVPSDEGEIEFKDNPESLFNKTDLVFIDAPNTGFGRISPSKATSKFYSVEADAQVFADFILAYIKENHREESPKYLFGESYGTTRTAILAHLLQSEGVMLDGVILTSPNLNHKLMRGQPFYQVWPYAFYLPSLAAVSWYFHASSYHPQSLSVLLNEVENFVVKKYLPALLAIQKNKSIPALEMQDIASHLHRYLGIPTKEFLDNNLRLSMYRFLKILLPNKFLKRWDGRQYGSFTNKEFQLYVGYHLLSKANDTYYRDIVPYEAKHTYRRDNKSNGRWNFSYKGEDFVQSYKELILAMKENPKLRVFIANGYYDLATPFFATQYLLMTNPYFQTNKNKITYHLYSSGHMIYLDPVARIKMSQDLQKWYGEHLN